MAIGMLNVPRRTPMAAPNVSANDIPGNAEQYVMVEIPNVGLVKVRKSMVAPGIPTHPVNNDLISQIPTRRDSMEDEHGVGRTPIEERKKTAESPVQAVENKPENIQNPALTLQNLQQTPSIPEIPQNMGASAVQQPPMGSPAMPGDSHLPPAMSGAAETAPVNPAMPETGAGGIRGFLNSPTGLGILNGFGEALMAKSQNPRDPMTGAFFKGLEEGKKTAGAKEFASQITQANLTPQQKAFVQYAVTSGDPKLMETATKMLFPANANKPVSVAAGGTLVDPATGKVIYQSKSQKTTNAIVNAEAIGLKQGTKEFNDFVKEQTVGKSGSVFQKNELAFAQQVANDTKLEGQDLDNAIQAYKVGDTHLPDGRELPPMSQTAREKLDIINKARTTGALVTAGVQANQAHAEMQVFDKYIKKGNAHYGDTIAGYSPKFEKDSANSRSDKSAQDRLSDYYVGQILNFDKAQTQIRIAMANPSVSTTEDLIKISENTIKQFAPIKSGVVKNLTIEKLSKALSDALAVRNAYGIGASGAFNPRLGGIGEAPATPAAAPQEAKPKMTEADIQYNVQKYGKSREQVIQDAKSMGYL